MALKRVLIIMALLSLASAGRAAYRIEHLEPPFWWAGMKSAKLELLIHGNDIAALEPSVDSAGVTIVDVHRTGNPNYLFLELQLSPDVQPGAFRIDFARDGTSVLQHQYELRAREDGSASRKGFDSSDVIYLITPDRFANGDAENDEVAGMADGLDRGDPDGRHGGDLAGVVDHLDYVADMGFTQIWLNPVLQNDQPQASYHGYAITDFYAVDARFGSNAGYRALSAGAAARDIGMIMDVVLNHCGSRHWWIADPPAGDWINHDGRFVATTHDRASLFDPHGAASDRARFNQGWFVPTMPDLNQRNPQLATYLVQNAIWWVEYAGLSGLRVDTWPYSDKSFLTEWGRRLTEEYPGLNIVGEEWITNPAMVAYWQRGTLRQDSYESFLPSLMDFPLHDAAIRGLKEATGPGLDRIYRLLANDFLYADAGNLVVFPDNHDMSRIYTQLDERFDLYRIALTFFLTTRGIPQLYYGDEILMANPGTDAHGVIRSDFPGGWPGDGINAFTGEGLTPLQREAQALTRKLLRWRQSASAVHGGRLTQYAPEDGTYTYFREDSAQTLMVVINNSGASSRLDMARFSESVGDAETGTDVITGQRISLSGGLDVPAASVSLLELR